MRTNWNDERTEACVKMWNGGLSAGVISAHLGGTTRNAVIGKIHRLAKERNGDYVISRKPVPRKMGVPQPPRRRRLSKPWGKVKSLEPIEATPLPPEQPAPDKLFKLVDMEPDQCRFYYGDPKLPGSGFCGCPIVPGTSYCPGHLSLCTNAVQPVRRYGNMGHLPSGNALVENADLALEAIG